MPKPIGWLRSRTTKILVGDVLNQLRTLSSSSVHCCVTSPPYWGLRDYGVAGQIGLEKTPAEYIARMVEVFAEVHRVLRDDGTLWLNIGDSYTSGGRASFGTFGPDSKQATHPNIKQTPRSDQPPGMKPKDLVGIPWMLAFALRDFGWYLRQDIIWHKPAPMPEPVRDRCTKAHEYIFLLTKRPRYYYDAEAVKEASVDPEGSAKRYAAPFFVGDKHESGGYAPDGATHTGGMKQFEGTRNPRSIWSMVSLPFKGKHFAVFPPEIVERCVLAGTSAVGCCPVCHKPWKRNIASERVSTRPGADTKVAVPKGWQVGPGSHNTISHQTPEGERVRLAHIVTGNRDPQRHVSVSLTKGWEQDCEHLMGRERLVPCTVIDPFVGSGTTVITAELLGRSAVGIDLDSRVHDFIALRRPEVEKWFTKRNKRKMKEDREKAEERITCAE